MSTYMNFFIRENDNFIPLFTYNARTPLGELMEGYTPWEKVRALSTLDVAKLKSSVKEEIAEKQAYLTSLKRQREALQGMRHEDIDEIVRRIEYTLQDEDETNEEIETYKFYEHMFDFISLIQDEYVWKDEKRANNLVYVGLEVGDPTLEDVF